MWSVCKRVFCCSNWANKHFTCWLLLSLVLSGDERKRKYGKQIGVILIPWWRDLVTTGHHRIGAVAFMALEFFYCWIPNIIIPKTWNILGYWTGTTVFLPNISLMMYRWGLCTMRTMPCRIGYFVYETDPSCMRRYILENVLDHHLQIFLNEFYQESMQDFIWASSLGIMVVTISCPETLWTKDVTCRAMTLYEPFMVFHFWPVLLVYWSLFWPTIYLGLYSALLKMGV